MERRNNVDMYFVRLVFTLHETAFSAMKHKQIDKETNRSEKTFINDDWRLRNDLPYKAVKPTWIKLQNHLSKLNVTHTRAAKILRRSGEKWREQRYILWQSIINFHYELCWSEKLMGKPFFSRGKFPRLQRKVHLSRFDCFPLPDPRLSRAWNTYTTFSSDEKFLQHVFELVTMKTIRRG